MDPFLGEIRAFPYGFTPKGWASCNGQKLQISQYAALYSLLGLTYGGDGRQNFGLPNLQGNVAVNQGQGAGLSSYAPGQTAGSTTVTLAGNQMAPHTHTLNASDTVATQVMPPGNILARAGLPAGRGAIGNQGMMYSTNAGNATTALAAASIGPVGSGGSHNNLQPYVAINFCIALIGVYPQRP